MTATATLTRRAQLGCLMLLLVAALPIEAISLWPAAPAAAQEAGPLPADAAPTQPTAGIEEGLRAAEAELDAGAAQQEAAEETTPTAATTLPGSEKKINLLTLLVAGGYLMLPIAAMSILVVTFGVERLLGLRRRKVLPPQLIADLGKMAASPGGFNPRQAYRLCQRHPSTASNVIKVMLLKVGRPHAEVEHTVSEASDREASRLYANVRWLSLAAAVSPLLGLLGTVWGMIMAFFRTANMPTGANKAEFLAQGIYVALVTTFAGLAVAIPAAVLAHTFEGRVQRLFRELAETLLGLLPQLERFEGRLRVNQDQLDGSAAESPVATGAAATGATASGVAARHESSPSAGGQQSRTASP